IGEGLKRRMALREEARLYLLGDCQVVGGPALGLQLCRFGTTLGLYSTCRLVDFNQREAISVHIFENSVPFLPPPPGWHCRRDYKTDPCFDHSSKTARTTSVKNPTPVFWPMRLTSSDPSRGATSAIPGRPVGGVAMIQRPTSGTSLPGSVAGQHAR